MTKSTDMLENFGNDAQLAIERSSRQKPEPEKFFTSTLSWIKKAEMNEPGWGQNRADFVDNRVRDEWLMAMARQEPHLGSVLSTAVTMDANRQYRLIGGRNQVLRFVERFKNFDNGLGFRTMQELNAYNYYAADLGSVVEIETMGKNGPLQSLYHTDPTRLRLGKKGQLKYDVSDIWKPGQYYRLASQKSTQDKYNQLGYCAISRCIKLAQTMIAIVEHNLEKLGHIAPKGILFIQAEDLTLESWEQAMQARKAVYITNTGNQYYDEVVTIVDRAAKGDLLALSQLPDGFDSFMFTDYMLKAYALAFNRDVRAFWSLNSGNFGGGTEAALQSEKATYGGAAEFILASQEQIQWLLPDTLTFEYEVDDTRGKVQKAELYSVLVTAAKDLIEIGLPPKKALQWLAEQGVIPSEWTAETEDEIAENGVLRSTYMSYERVISAKEKFVDEPIIMYESPSLYYPSGRITRLWDTSQNKFLIGVKKKVTRELRIEDHDPDQSSSGSFMFLAAILAYYGDRELNDEEQELVDEVESLLNQDEITSEEVDDIQNALEGLLPTTVVAALILLRIRSDDAPEGNEEYAERWNTRLRFFDTLGRLYGTDEDTLFTWHFGDTKHCTDCANLNGVTKTAGEWLDGGLLPQSSALECKGFHCQCILAEEH